MTSGIASKGADLDSIFDPYVAGTTKARATGGEINGTDLNARYAPIVYGSAAPATGIYSQGADLNTLFAAKGTASYSLACNGYTYNTAGISNSSISFTFSSTSAWAIAGISSSTPAGGPASGSLPAGAVKYMLTVSNSGTTSGITTVATGVWASIASGLTLVTIALNSSTEESASSVITLELQNAAGDTISTTNLTLYAHVTGTP